MYSASYLELGVADDSSSNQYFINWSWDAVPGAEGYRVLKSDSGSGLNFDHFYDVATTDFIDTGSGLFTAGAEVSPNDTAPAVAGDAVSQWQDQSGQNNHATEVASSGRAILQANSANGRPALRFDANDGYATPLVLNRPCTVIAVYSYRSEVATARRAVQGTGNWLIGPYSLKRDFFNGSNFTNGPAVVQNQFTAHAAWQNGTNSRNWLNGEFVGNTLAAGVNPGTLGLGVVGAFPEGLDGDLAEVIAYDSALSDANLAGLWSYLAGKYALS